MRWMLFLIAYLVFAPSVHAQEGEYPHGDFSGNCTDCHNEEQWVPVKFGTDWKHPDVFNLRGTHRAVPCRNCHLTLDFTKAPTYCAGCHTDPHRAEMGTDCELCHTPTNFLDRSAQRERHRSTRFPLFGAHAVQDCESCHISEEQGRLTWVGTPVECVACHLQHYNNATDPNHRLAGFPTNCEQCHTPRLWEQARFTHTSNFRLTGAHRSLPCSECHRSVYRGTSSDCYACHAANYNGTMDPNHVLLAFPTDCRICHNTSSFEGASFAQHDNLYFPIYSGRHDGRWSACSDCHPNPSNFSQLGCISCHTDDEAEADEHDGVWDNANCLGCHPQGEAP